MGVRRQKTIALGAGIALVASCFSERPDTTEPVPEFVSCSSTAPAPPAGVRLIRIQNFQFQPAQLTVTRGTTIYWINCEPDAPQNFHTSTSDDGVWGSPGLAPAGRGTYSRLFDAAGTFPYHCIPHPNMQASITVT